MSEFYDDLGDDPRHWSIRRSYGRGLRQAIRVVSILAPPPGMVSVFDDGGAPYVVPVKYLALCDVGELNEAGTCSEDVCREVHSVAFGPSSFDEPDLCSPNFLFNAPSHEIGMEWGTEELAERAKRAARATPSLDAP